MKLSKDQRGLAGVAEAGLIGVLLVVIVFAGTRVYNATRSADQANQQAVKISQTSPDFSKVDTLEEEKKQVEEPKKEEAKPETVAVSEAKPKTEEVPDKKKTEPTWIDLDYTGVSETADAYTFSATLGGSRTGFCKAKFYKGNNFAIAESDDFSNKSMCSVSVPKDQFSQNGLWEGYVKFYSSDGKYFGATATISLGVN